MKKFINDVWTVQLPKQEINISSDVPESDIKDFVKGKGDWGENALYLKRKDSFTVFEDTGEATNYVNYTKSWDRSFTDILNEASTPAEFNGIVQYVNTYKDGLVLPDGYVAVPETPSNEKLVEIATFLDSNYPNLTESEQQDLLNQAQSTYNFITGLY